MTKRAVKKKRKDLIDIINKGVPKHFIITNETYNQSIVFCINMSPKQILKVLEKWDRDFTKEDRSLILSRQNVGGIVEGQMYPLSIGGYCVYINWRKDSYRKNIVTANHEIIHVAHYILRNVRVPLKVNTEEVYTYLIGDIFKQFLFKLY